MTEFEAMLLEQMIKLNDNLNNLKRSIDDLDADISNSIDLLTGEFYKSTLK